jgi:hypothetical protein
MLSYYLGTLLIGAFIYLDGHNIVKNTVMLNFQRFRQVNKLVSTKYKGCFKIIWISIGMIFKLIWINILQRINKTVVQIDKKRYEVTYIIKGKIYKMIVTPNRGPRKVLVVSDENQEEISSLIFPYLGPEDKFHGQIYTPKFFKRKELIFELSNGNEKIFSENEDILI